jgi:uncharacterized YccA/Bax inhibitor family protein
MMRSGNPVLNDKTFTRHVDLTGEDRMTLMGTVHKTAFLLILLVAFASITWKMVMTVNAEGQMVAAPGLFGYMIGGAIGGLIFALITMFKPTWAPITAPIYAALEGLFIGALSAFAESHFPGIVLQAVGLTFGTLFALLGAYRSGFIKATENFKLGMSAAMGGIFLVYMASFILRMFGTDIPLIHEAGLVGIGFSAFVVVIAALNLVLDFDFIENGADNGAPKYMEWLGAFSLMVTLVWLYIEILHLLMKLRSR